MNSHNPSAEIETIIEQFETAWHRGDRPRIEDFLSDSLADRQSLLIELVLTDLEYRLKSGEVARVEEYLEQHPELRAQPDATAKLIRFEYLIRKSLEPEVQPAEFVWRFPKQYHCLVEGHTLHGDGIDSSDINFEHPRDRQLKISIEGHGQRFVLEKKHAEGGLGTVWKARDKMFGRQVAIKEVKSLASGKNELQSRLKQEAHITARLEHPGIVPIYATGRFDDGGAFYAMRYIQGKSFREVIDEYHQQASKTLNPSDRNIGLRRLLGSFVDVCNTIHYAHAQNAIHRDIKPHNIMIGEFGETMVVDWGLAKDLNQPLEEDRHRDDQADAETTPSDSRLETRQGEVIGSLGYMSPEQAAGNIDQLDQRTDIYSLGATFFTLLTNQDPVNGFSKNELKNYPRALTSICAKAMASEPSDRYAGADELANEIERFLADEKTMAHQESLTEKMARIGRRYQRLIQVAAVSLAVLTVVTAVAVFWINNERQIAIEAAETADLERLRAEDAAMLFPRILRSPDQQYVPTDMTARQLLEQGVKNIEVVDDAVMRGRLLNAMSHAFAALGDIEQAMQCSEKSWAILRQQPNADHRLRLKTLNRLANVYAELGYHYTANEMVEESLTIYDKHPEAGLEVYLEALSLRSSINRKLQKRDQALADAQRAYQLSVDGNGPLARQTLHLYDMLGIAKFANNQKAEAKQAYDKIIELRTQHPQLNQTDIFVTWRNLALWHEDRNDYDSAIQVRKTVMDGLVTVLGPFHSETLEARRKYNRSRFFCGFTNDAIDDLHLMQDQLIQEKGADDLEVFQGVKLLSWLYRNQAKYDKTSLSGNAALASARPKYTVSDSIQVLDDAILRCDKSKLGPENLIALELREQLAWAYASNNETNRAIEVRQEQLKIWEQRIQKQDLIHGNYLKCLDHLAKLLKKDGQTLEAKKIAEQAADFRKQQRGPI